MSRSWGFKRGKTGELAAAFPRSICLIHAVPSCFGFACQIGVYPFQLICITKPFSNQDFDL
jgi:hypothetical protein